MSSVAAAVGDDDDDDHDDDNDDGDKAAKFRPNRALAVARAIAFDYKDSPRTRATRPHKSDYRRLAARTRAAQRATSDERVRDASRAKKTALARAATAAA